MALTYIVEEEALIKQINVPRRKFFKVRSNRIRPGLDDKVLISWNTL
ncbi:MAG: hypothetical protein KDC85_10430 [Saprospiraceae bacterium]|nr:hypothetical protein [Saprospiraceae bacterium]MCB9325761.1 hypothetical protein [Lewinellaceae bacterium]